MVRREEPFKLMPPSAASAAPMCWTSFCARSRSFFNCWITPDMCAIETPGRIIDDLGN